jgi:hypothetical protein
VPIEFYTTEVRWTDRIFATSGKYFNHILEEPIPNFSPGLLFSTLNGSIGNIKILPFFGVKWITPPTEIAILTEINTKERFEAQLFHFGKITRNMKVRFLNLLSGKYYFNLTGNKKKVFSISLENRDFEFTLPSRKQCKLIVEKLN